MQHVFTTAEAARIKLNYPAPPRPLHLHGAAPLSARPLTVGHTGFAAQRPLASVRVWIPKSGMESHCGHNVGKTPQTLLNQSVNPMSGRGPASCNHRGSAPNLCAPLPRAPLPTPAGGEHCCGRRCLCQARRNRCARECRSYQHLLGLQSLGCPGRHKVACCCHDALAVATRRWPDATKLWPDAATVAAGLWPDAVAVATKLRHPETR